MRNGLSVDLDATRRASAVAEPQPASAAASAASAVSRRIRRPRRPRARLASAPSSDRPCGAARAARSVERERAPALAVEQLVVVEVDVHDRRQRRARARARAAPSECVVGSSSTRRPSSSRTHAGLVERGARRRPAAGTTAARRSRCSRRTRARRPPRSRRASVYQPPPQKKRGSSPCSRSQRPRAAPLGRDRPPVGRAWVGDVQCVWWPNGPSAAASRARSTKTAAVLALGRRAHQRRDRETPPGGGCRGSRYRSQTAVVERPFDVARHDRVALRTGHVRDLRTPRQGRARPGAGRAHERGDRTSRPRSRCRRGLRPLRARLPAARRSSTSRPATSRSTSERGDVVAVFNGELYNFRELRRELEAKGHEIRGTRRLAADPARLRGVGPRLRRSGSRGCSRSRSGTAPRERLVLAARPARQEAAALRAAARRLARVRVGDEGAAQPAEPAARARPRPSSTRSSRCSTSRAPGCARSRRCRPARYVVAENGAVRVERYWSSATRPARRRTDEREWVERVRERGDRGGAPAARRRRAARRAALGRDRLVDRRRRDGARRRPSRCGRSRSASPTRATTSGRTPALVAERFGTRHEELEVDPAPRPGRAPRARLRRAVRRRGGAADAARLRGDAAARHGRARRRRRRRGVRRLRALPRRTRSPGACPGSPPRSARRRSARSRRPAAEPRSTLFRARRFLDAAAQPAAGALRPPRRGLPARAAPAAVDGRGARARDARR